MVIHKKTTIIDVARLSGFSISTVSRVLNGNYPVKRSTKEKIQETIDELKFSPNILARGLIGAKTSTIGIIVPSLENLFFSELIRGIDDILRDNDYTAFICSTNEDDILEKKHISNLVDRKVDGIISISPDTRCMGSEYEVIAKSMPVIIVNGEHEGLNYHCVSSDQGAGTINALEYLISEGHKNIAFLRGHDIFAYNIKEDLFRDLLLEKGLKLEEALVARISAGNSISTVDESMLAMLKIFNERRDFTALFACNDLMAVGALNAALQLNIKVPQELRIIGFDNTLICDITQPTLSSVDQGMKLLGVTSAQKMMALINGDASTISNNIIKTKLVLRKT
ncbi:MAG: LacI family transcriptional regulator [Firmicutes bacterium HGW-Firmicutes-1]|jgi:LacI family transcriptional regulator|nr:MAG: LacI family transcriptional regulator [Firmicutes bacterium HGW-Firmicutes-1]